MYLPLFTVDTPDIKEPEYELNQLTIRSMFSLTQTGDPKIKNGYKDSILQSIGIRVLGI